MFLYQLLSEPVTGSSRILSSSSTNQIGREV